MRLLVEYRFEDGETVLVESAEANSTIRGGGLSGAIEKATMTFDSSLATIKPIAEATLKQLERLTKMPESVEVEFALKFTASAGVVIAESGAEATMRFKLTWKP